jgi:ABC-type glycerol-3-phosphate transport system substrate-binding protein
MSSIVVNEHDLTYFKLTYFKLAYFKGRSRARLYWRGLLVTLMVAMVTACGNRTLPTPTPLPPLTPTALIQPTTGTTPTTGSNGNDQLILWMPAFTGLASGGNAGTILSNAFHQFEQRNPNIKLDIQVKADSGTASLFNFLRSAQQVAPAILPDLVLINTQQLWQLVDLGIVKALTEDELLDAELYPLTRSAILYNTQTMGIPYTIDLIHLAYAATEVGSPPSNWTEMLAADHPFIFPGAENALPTATLLQYVGAGGILLENGSVNDPAALEQLFTFVAQARERNIIPNTVVEISGFNSVWSAYTEQPGQLATVQVNQFSPNATGIDPPSYSHIPTRSGETVTIADTWAFAVLTQDVQRRQLILALVSELLAPEVQGPWSQFASRLPSQPAAFALWTTQPNGYNNFLQQLLDNAIVPPNGPAFADFARRLQAAQAGVLRNELTPAAAVNAILVVE